MCGRYSFVWLLNKLQDQFGPIRFKGDGVTRYNVAPGSKNPVILEDDSQTQVVDFFRWGLVPAWARDKPGFGFRTINARVEGVADSGMYKTAFFGRRCIVPASGFFEWRKSGAVKVPFYVHPKSLDYFGFAGIYESWKVDSGEFFNSYSIITRESNAEMSKLHDRMPVILKKEHYKDWVGGGLKPVGELLSVLGDFDSDFEFYPVSRDVNNPKNDSEALVRPLLGL